MNVASSNNVAELPENLENRVSDLLSAMTIDEKLSLCAGQNFWETRGIPRVGLEPFRMTDGPRGVAFHSSRMKRCTAFPSGVAQAASWDEELMARFGQALAEETKSTGARMILAPAINITRTPLNGRTFEYLSEDPLLNARLTVPMVKGIQSRGVAACVKHFAANNQETHRMRNSSEVSERALQEIYLPAFKAAVEQADAWSIMAAYNAVNGIAACENEELLQTRLRGEYGFRGFVVSDWFAVRRTSSPQACIKAGLNLEMPGKGSRYRTKNLKEAYSQGLFSEDELDANLSALLRVMALTGHLDEAEPRGERNTPEHQELAREMAESGITLLKNDGGLLPLDSARVKKVALLGPKLDRRNCWPLWGGSAGVWPPYEVTPKQGLERENRGRFQFVSSVAEADVVLLFAGIGHRPGFDSEAKDRHSLDLPADQVKLINETVVANPNTVVVLTNGGPLTMPWLEEVPAVLETWYPGMEGGKAIARILFGDASPSGKLPLSFPRALADSPAHRSGNTFPGDRSSVHYEEELFVGYRHFDKAEIQPLFPFGHGLSYTDFSYSKLQLSQTSLSSHQTLEISMRLANTGEHAGAEVVQLYVRDLQAGEDRPALALKGFAKRFLQAGEEIEVTFQLAAEDLLQFCPQLNSWQLPGGKHRILLGSSSQDIRLQADLSVIVD